MAILLSGVPAGPRRDRIGAGLREMFERLRGGADRTRSRKEECISGAISEFPGNGKSLPQTTNHKQSEIWSAWQANQTQLTTRV